LRTFARAGAVHQQEWPHGDVREIPEGTPGPGCAAVAWRTRPAHLREYFEGRLEALGRAHEDDPERVPPDALAEGSAGPRSQAHGRLFLRRRCGAASRIRPPAGQISIHPVTASGRNPPQLLAVIHY